MTVKNFLVKRRILPPDFHFNYLSLLNYLIISWIQNLLSTLASSDFPFGPPITIHFIRPFLHRVRGCKIGRNVSIGSGVVMGLSRPELISIWANTWITSDVFILEHKRDIRNLTTNNTIRDMPHLFSSTVIEHDVHIGIRSVIMPGVRIGHHSIVGAGSVVTKDVSPYSIVAGNPAKVLKKVPNDE